MDNSKIEIVDICDELEKLAGSGILLERTAEACIQAASFLKAMLDALIPDRVSSGAGVIATNGLVSDAVKVEKLMWLLSEQGHG